MATINTQYAFPLQPSLELRGQVGLTKREYFAALNHAAIIGAAAFNQESEDMMIGAGIDAEHIESYLAHLAVEAADALIAELNKP